MPLLEVFSDTTTIIGDYISPSLYATKKVTVLSGSTTIYSLATTAYTGAFFDYTIVGNDGARSGNIMSIWSGATVNLYETKTTDIGSTTGVTFSMSISGNSVLLTATSQLSACTLKTIVRSI